MRALIVVILSLTFVSPSVADTFSLGDFTVNINVGCPSCYLNGSFTNKSNSASGTITSINWKDDSFTTMGYLGYGKFLVLFKWDGDCKGSYFAYASFPNASEPTISPQVPGDTLILDFLMGAGCDGSYGPLKLTLKKDTGKS